MGLGAGSRVIELGSNDGHLLQFFVARGIPVLGIEPAKNVAEKAIARGVPTITQQLSYIRSWGGQFVVPIPDVKVHS